MTLSALDLTSITGRAMTLWERLASPGPWREDGPGEEALRRLERWQEVVARGDGRAFERRLAVEGLRRADALRALAGAASPAKAAPWTAELPDLCRHVAHHHENSGVFEAAAGYRPRPFEHLLRPLVCAARMRLRRRRGAAPSDAGALTSRLFGAEACTALEAGLLDQLAQLCGQCLQTEFTAFRPAGHQLLNSLVGATAARSSRHYEAFVRKHLADGLTGLFSTYPVLARLVVHAIENWVDCCHEFQTRLEQDSALLERHFGDASGAPPGQVGEIRFGLSDRHAHGRSVIGLRFANGRWLAYKPRPMGVDVAYGDLIGWINRQGPSVALKTLRVLDRGRYGWMEWADALPCADSAEALAFFRRAGMLLATMHGLRGTDCHYENLIAHGGHLLPIDLETLFTPELVCLVDGLPDTVDASFWESVIHTGMLPRLDDRYAGTAPCDISGLGGIEAQPTPGDVPQWKNVNTDDMDIFLEPMILPRRSNGASLAGKTLCPTDHEDELLAGFREMYGLLRQQRAALLASDGILQEFRRRAIRYVFRPTEQYSRILRHSLAAQYLKNGCDRSIEIDRLASVHARGDASPSLPPVVKAERTAIEGFDIPRLEALTDRTDLLDGTGTMSSRFFGRSGYDRVVERLNGFCDGDLAQQVRIIRSSLAARRAAPGTGPYEAPRVRPITGHPSWTRSDQFHARAMHIADEILAQAMTNPDGSLSWMHFRQLSKPGTCQLEPVDDGLYAGRCGIALFLAACDQAAPHEGYRRAVAAALEPLRRVARRADDTVLHDYVRRKGLGIGSGVGGIVYALTRISQWWHDDGMLAEAERLAFAVGDDAIRQDQALDVIGGSAGALLGLATLHSQRPDPALLEMIRSCAAHLASSQIRDGQFRGGWQTPSGKRPLTGFAHGASGIAHALNRARSVTAMDTLHHDIAEALRFEGKSFDQETGNWVDHRFDQAEGRPRFSTSWCHGAPGIALARTGLHGLDQTGLRRELETALATTRDSAFEPVDHLCCGNFGRFDILHYAAERLGQPALAADAARQAHEILDCRDTFHLPLNRASPLQNAGLFEGTAGIGYAMLRLAHPGKFACVLAVE